MIHGRPGDAAYIRPPESPQPASHVERDYIERAGGNADDSKQLWAFRLGWEQGQAQASVLY